MAAKPPAKPVASKAPQAAAAHAKKTARHAQPKGRQGSRAKHHRTKAQIAGAKRGGLTRHKHHLAQLAAKKGKKTPVTAKKPAAPAIVDSADLRILPVLDEPYGAGLHILPVCAAVVVAEHLAAFTGDIALEDDILDLHRSVQGCTLADLLEYLQVEGFSGARLISSHRCDEDQIAPGMICGIPTRNGYHAVLAYPAGMASWGTVMPWTAAPAEAWHLEWETR